MAKWLVVVGGLAVAIICLWLSFDAEVDRIAEGDSKTAAKGPQDSKAEKDAAKNEGGRGESNKPPGNEDARAVLEAGLQADYYDMSPGLNDFPAIPADKKPKVSRVEKEINYDSVNENFGGTGLSLHFYVRWTGVLRIPKDGKYVLYTLSDDGSRVILDGARVVDSPGLHGMEEKDSEILSLKAGDHEIEIQYFQNEGAAGCKLLWSSNELEKAVIPASALFHKKAGK